MHRYLSKQRQIDPAEQMFSRASDVARLLPAAFVVMGHTHCPTERPLSDGRTTYINLGSWAEEEQETPSERAYRAARTHLVIQQKDDGAHAELRQWSSDGPTRFKTK
jgi:UDP-2,3-diacylglucosamine pyrophosphatase LpxH